MEMKEKESAQVHRENASPPASPFVFANPKPPGDPQNPSASEDIHRRINLTRSPFRVANLQVPNDVRPENALRNNPFGFDGPNIEAFVPPAPPPTKRVTNEFYEYLPLGRAISRGDLRAVKDFLNLRPDAITAWIDFYETPLLKACSCGRPEIVKELLRRMTPEQMISPRENENFPYHTPLTVASVNGNMEIAEALVAKNPKLLEVPGHGSQIPVVKAVMAAQKEMARFLYPLTPLPVLLAYDGFQGSLLLRNSIVYGMLDIALDVFEACPRMGVAKHPLIPFPPISSLALRSDLFLSGCDLGFWQRLIYSCVEVKPQIDSETSSSSRNQYQSILWKILQCLPKWFGIDRICELKEMHLKAVQLVRGMSEEISAMGKIERSQNGFEEAFFFAVRSGNKELLVEMIKRNSEFLWVSENSSHSNIFLLAVEFRQEKIFNLLYGLDERRDMLLTGTDNVSNGILHIAGRISPPDVLAQVPGAALQMQRELQWFKEVERLAPEIDKVMQNAEGLRPRDIFDAAHGPLRKEAEEWMKGTATSCSLVAALIATVTFQAIFTVPGGTDQASGNPLHLREARFMVFVISDIISFFASCTSVLIFLGMLTARYSLDDFLVSLPSKMIAGLSTQFISVAAMLVAFSTALFTMLEEMPKLAIPVLPLTCLPTALFVMFQYPLLKEFIASTYGRGIFKRDTERWL
ncbi:PREDICTED: uncharacterized protein LOC104823186 [Tarenaya hassleriana]|uniref:uncharacterized protein LOC104823186 n=1 Tax=Tarenaya hassleriana TaxID=28532 RepID=UPI00053C6AAA|nr:PREDICTED: uncharacterized protein LOC104823186 [Tarenaya hassleriana]